MLTLAIRYTLDAGKLAEYEAYAREVPAQAVRCGALAAQYYAPTKFAGPTNATLALLDFESLAAYERYRERLASDAEVATVLRRVEATRAVLVEDRTILRRVASAPR
ncbi:MAG TPA: NIPSNAP family protein [Stellaceae bacterium]|nr:NIPSNAP family protein [Stellaceae bacterium]